MKPNPSRSTFLGITLLILFAIGNVIGATLPCGSDPTPIPAPPQGWGSGPVKISGGLSEPSTIDYLQGNTLGLNRQGDIFFAWNGKVDPSLSNLLDSTKSIFLYRYDGSCHRSTIHKIDTANRISAYLTRHQIVTDDNRNTIVLSESADNGALALQAFNYVHGTGWSSTVMDSAWHTAGELTAQVQMDGDGNAWVMWTEIAPYGNAGGQELQINARRYQPGKGWQPTSIFAPAHPSVSGYGFNLTTHQSGRTLVVRPLRLGNRYSSREWSATTGSWLPEQIFALPFTNLVFPHTTTDGTGKVTVAATIGGVLDYVIYISQNTPGASPYWSSPTYFGNGDVYDMQSNNVGEVGMLFQKTENNVKNLYYSSKKGEAPWSAPYFIASEPHPNARVALDDNGNTIVVWQKNKRVWSRRYSCQATLPPYPPICMWGSNVELSNFASIDRTAGPIIRVQPGTGNAVVVWRQDNAMYMRRFYK